MSVAMNTIQSEDKLELNVIVEAAWEEPLKELKSKLDLASQNIADILLVEDQRRNRGREDDLKRTMGQLASSSLDLSAVSKLLQKDVSKSTLNGADLSRITSLADQLKAWRQNFDQRAPACRITPLHDLKEIEEEAVDHLNAMAELFKLMRMAWLERNSRYDPKVHDAFFAAFNWEYLNNDEVALCPPFVVTMLEGGDRDFYYSTLLPLVTSGLPVKVVMEKNDFRNRYQNFNRSTALRCSLEIEMLPVALKGVFVMQDTVSRPQCIDHLQQGLRSPRPALFSLYNNPDQERCNLAVSSRALPLFLYDPDGSDIFLKRFYLQENPEQQKTWATMTLEYLDSESKKDRLDRRYTFADFAASESQYQDDFSDLPADQESRGVEIADYLEMNFADRSNKLPYIQVLDSIGYLQKKVPSMRIVAQTDDKRHLWQSLCEVSGINNPFLTVLEKQIRDEEAEIRSKALAELRSELSADIEAQRAAAIKGAMANLAARLAGLSNESFDGLSSIGSTVENKPAEKPASSKPIEQAAAPEIEDSEDTWVETKLCTSCDECTTIAPNVFAYDDNKQAYVSNPRGDVYKKIVKAAGKCPAKIIHVGKEF